MVQIHLKQVNYQRASVHLHVYIYILCIYCVYNMSFSMIFMTFSWLFHDFPYFHRDIGDVMAGMLAWESCEVSQYMETVQAGSKQWKHSQVWIELYNVYCMHVYLYLYLYIYRDFIEGCISSFPEKIKDLWMWYSVHSFSVRGLLSISPRSLMAHQKSC
jgi:hypothetical protein